MSASDNLQPGQFEHVPMEHLPVHPAPHGISDQDVPAEYAKSSPSWADRVKGTYSLHQVPLADLHDHEHNAECYLPTEENRRRHDVAEDDHDGEHYDYHYVKNMAKDVERLPALVGWANTPGGKPSYFGGGHRTAAFREAGRTHIPMWVQDQGAAK